MVPERAPTATIIIKSAPIPLVRCSNGDLVVEEMCTSNIVKLHDEAAVVFQSLPDHWTTLEEAIMAVTMETSIGPQRVKDLVRHLIEHCIVLAKVEDQ